MEAKCPISAEARGVISNLSEACTWTAPVIFFLNSSNDPVDWQNIASTLEMKKKRQQWSGGLANIDGSSHSVHSPMNTQAIQRFEKKQAQKLVQVDALDLSV